MCKSKEFLLTKRDLRDHTVMARCRLPQMRQGILGLVCTKISTIEENDLMWDNKGSSFRRVWWNHFRSYVSTERSVDAKSTSVVKGFECMCRLRNATSAAGNCPAKLWRSCTQVGHMESLGPLLDMSSVPGGCRHSTRGSGALVESLTWKNE